MHLMLVEDDEQLRQVLAAALRQRGYEVTLAADGRSASARVEERPDAVLLDLGLPDIDGVELIRRLRPAVEGPIVVLSGSREVDVVARALDAGADDFVAKPFRLPDVEARLRAVSRRADGAPEVTVVRRGDLAIDLRRRTVTRGQVDVRLTPTEWKVLEALVTSDGRLVSYDALATAVWGGQDFIQARESLRVHVASLRAKLSGGSGRRSVIETASGIGYRWVAADRLPGGETPADADERAGAVVAHDGDGSARADDRRLRHDLNNAVAALTVIAGILDPTVDLGDDVREEARRRLAGSVANLRSLSDRVAVRLGGEDRGAVASATD